MYKGKHCIIFVFVRAISPSTTPLELQSYTIMRDSWYNYIASAMTGLKRGVQNLSTCYFLKLGSKIILYYLHCEGVDFIGPADSLRSARRGEARVDRPRAAALRGDLRKESAERKSER